MGHPRLSFSPKLITFTLVFLVYPTALLANAIKPWFPNLANWSIEWAEANADHERDATLFERLLIVIDPPTGTILDGRITLNYDPLKLSIEEFGWFGPWGVNPSLPAPAVSNSGRIAHDTQVILQSPNPALSQSVNTGTTGTVVVDFSWGSGGLAQTEERANIFGLWFIVLNPGASAHAEFSSFGTGDIREPSGAGNFMTCIPQGQLRPGLCGESPQGDIRLVSTPEPSTVSYFAFALAFLGLRIAQLRTAKGPVFGGGVKYFV